MLTRSMSKPEPKALVRLKQPMRYLEGEIDVGKTYSSDLEFAEELNEYVSSDFVGHQEEWGFSTTGRIFHALD